MDSPATIHAPGAAPGKGSRIWNVTWRFGLVLLGAVCAAFIICDAVRSGGDTKINIATSGVAVGTLVAFFADLVALYDGCREYIRATIDSLQKLKANFWKAWASVTAIIIGFWAWVGPSGPDPWFIVYTSQAAPPPPETRRIAAIPALFVKDATADWTQGVAFEQEELDVSLKAFERIFAAFRACGSVTGKKPVDLTITGYASSRKFDDMTELDSNLYNVETANRRAWNAYCFAAGQVPVNLVNVGDWPGARWSCGETPLAPDGARAPIDVRVTYWPRNQAGFESMMRARPIQDWPHEILSKEPVPSEELDRRVDFYLNHAGACQVEGTSGAPITVASATN